MIYRLFEGTLNVRESECRVCGGKSRFTASSLKVCRDCLRERQDEALPYIREAHARMRSRFGLPSHPPKSLDGVLCNVCANECRMGRGETSFCGLKRNVDGRLESIEISPGWDFRTKSGLGGIIAFQYMKEGVLFDFPIGDEAVIHR